MDTMEDVSDEAKLKMYGSIIAAVLRMNDGKLSIPYDKITARIRGQVYRLVVVPDDETETINITLEPMVVKTTMLQ